MIRCTRWKDGSDSLRADLVEMDTGDHPDACRRILSRIYGITKKEFAVIERVGGREKYGS